MSNKSRQTLAQLLRKWVARGSRVSAPRPTAKLRLEEVETRVVPATTPAVTASAQIAVPNTGGGFTPQVVVDPTNPNTLAMVVAQPQGILAQVSFDGGVSWTKLRDTNSASPNNVPSTSSGDASRGMLIDPTRPLNAGLTRDQRAYTNASEPTVAFTRSGSVYIAYLQHNLDKTSGALVVERFDINRTAETFTYVDLDRARDWDNDPSTPASERWDTATLRDANGNLDNRAYVLYQWVDTGTTINRPANPSIGVDTNLGTYTDPATGETIQDPFVSQGGGDTIFVAWNMVSSAPSVDSVGPISQAALGFVPNAVMMAVGRVDPVALIDRPNPNAPVSASNPRQAAFLFSTPVPVNDGGHFIGAGNLGANTNNSGAAPTVSFNPATVREGMVTPGKMTVTWGTAGARVVQSTVDLVDSGGVANLGSSSYTFRSNDFPDSTAGSSFIADGFAPSSGPDIPGVTTFELRNVDLTPFTAAGGNGGQFTTLDDFDVTIALSHPNLSHLRIQLVAPDGTTVTLVRNRVNGDNSVNTVGGVNAGLAGTDLGVAAGIQGNFANQPQAIPGNPVGTVFSAEAARWVFDPNNPANYIGSYRPEAGSLSQFYGRSASGLNSGVNAYWRLVITDTRDDRITVNNNPVDPVQLVQFWSLTFTSRLDNSDAGGRLGTDQFVAGVSTVPMTNLATSTTGPLGGDQTFPTVAGVAGVSPTFGIGPGVTVAYDNSLGSFSPYAGRMYLAYTGGAGTNTNVFLTYSDDNGASWSGPVQVNDDSAADNFSEGIRSQYQPTVTVDPATGTVVVMWYDARTDASNTRVATYMATSIDGGNTFSANAPINTQKFAIDAITGKRVNLEPVPTNVGAMTTLNGGAYQYGGTGVRQAVVAFDGVIKAFWTGNANSGGQSIFSANVRTTAGPRVIESDLGSVSERSDTGTDDGTALILDENDFQRVITDAFGNARTTYNDTFAADGTRRIDGFRIVFDRPVYFGPNATTPDTVNLSEAFGADDVQVRFRDPSNVIDTATQGALIPVAGVRPIGGYSDSGSYFATAFFVQFQTPQTAVGTYSYAVGPAVSDRVRSQTSAVFVSADTPTTLADPGIVESQIVIPPLEGNLTVQNLQVGLNVTHPSVGQLVITLVAPDGTELILVDTEGGNRANLVNTRIADGGIPSPYPITNPFNNFNGIYEPSETFFTGRTLASAFGGKPLSGVWTLRVEDLSGGGTGTLNAWTLKFRDPAGNPLTINRLGNGMDQDADGIQQETTQDVYSVPLSLAGAPFTGPFDTASRPIVAPGAHVVRTYAGGQLASATSATATSGSTLRVVLDREVDITTFTRDAIASVVGPNGTITVTPGVQVFAVSPVDGGSKTFDIQFAGGTLQTGATYLVTLNSRVFVVDETALNSTIREVFVRFDRYINPASFTPGNVLRITGPTGAVSLAGVSVTAVDDARVPLAANAPAARLFRVTFDQPQLVVNVTAPQSSVAINLVATPTVGPLTLADVRVTGPDGVITPAALVRNSGTSYTLTFATPLPVGTYTIDFTATPNTIASSQNNAFTTIPFTLAAAPPNGTLTIGDVTRVFGPDGLPISLSGATLGGGPLNYTLTFPTSQVPGTYTIQLDPASLRGVAVVGSGVRLSGPYAIEFGSNPAIPDDTLAAIRATDRPQFVGVLAAAQNFIDVSFSSVTGAPTLADVLRVVGPTGPVTPTSLTLVSGTTYRLTFAATLPTGQYVIDFTESAARNIRVAGSGLPVDNNLNAGVAITTGRATATAAVVERNFPSASGPVAITPATASPTADDPNAVTSTTAEMAIVVNEDFVITQDQLNKIQVLLNIQYPDVWKLTVELVPPPQAGVPADQQIRSILLYSGIDDRPPNAPANQTGGANFTNTLLVDRLDPNDPSRYPSILDSFAPFGSPDGYNPQTPLSVLADPTRPFSAKGTWVLRVTNRGTASVSGQISNWTLTLPRSVPQSGLGERVADRFQAGFRVFTTAATNELSRDAWTPVSASSNETATAGRVTSVVVDPSDPSGNTVYVAGASGGVWKTTNFLTTDIDGPHYVPLTDFGPTTAIHIQSLALFPQNNDPAQTIVFAMTGEGNTEGLSSAGLTGRGRTSTGVGLLRSTDGGKTWAVLDSTNNRSTDPNAFPGTVGKVSDPGRDRLFVGTNGYKVVVDPNRTPEGGVLVYMAVSNGAPGAQGVWRSTDGGLTWNLVRAGDATDIVLGAGSATTFDPITQQTITDGNLQRLYASFRGEGVFFTDSAPSAAGLALMTGNQAGQLPNVRDVQPAPNGFPPTPTSGWVVGTNVQTAGLTPNGVAGGRIAISAPALTSDPVRNFYYKDWLYAVVVNANGGIVGLYQTKDAGQNWTRVRIPIVPPLVSTFGTNNETRADYDLFQEPIFASGNYDLSISVDPLNPAVIYLSGVGVGGATTGALAGGVGAGSVLSSGTIKLDLTKIKDTQNFANFNNSDAGGGTQGTTTGGLVPRYGIGGTGRLYRGFTGNTYGTDFINASRDPSNPFTTNSTLQVANVSTMTNDGTDVFWQPFFEILDPGVIRSGTTFLEERTGLSNIHSVFPLLDPVTGQTRLIYAGDQGVYTGVDRGDGTLTLASGFDQLVTGSRNGNLQLTQLYSGAVQPSQLAADVAGALFYGMAQDVGFLVSDPRILSNGNTNWRGPAGDGAWVEVDAGGSGRAFEYRSPSDYGIDGYVLSNPVTGGLPQEFLREFIPGRVSGEPAFGGGIPRTNGLIQTGDFAPPTGFGGQWLVQGGVTFAVNPVNPNALVIQSSAGRVFRSTTGGQSWLEIGAPGVFGNAAPGALAFGAFNSSNPSLVNNFIYVGTNAGTVFVTNSGGTSWSQLASPDNTPIRKIVPNPAAPSREVYVVTNAGVYYKADGLDTATPWTNITGNLFSLTKAAFGDTSDQVPVLPTATATNRAINTLAVDWRFKTLGGPGVPATPPDLYVGGVGGVFKSDDFGATWRVFPSITKEGSTADGGYLPTVEVTDLDLSIGNLNRTSGSYEAGGLNLLLASTYGRGSWAIRLSDNLPPTAFVKGPAVTAVSIPTQPGGSTTTISVIEVQFNGPVDAATLRPENFRLQPIVGGVPTGDVPILSITPTGIANRYQVSFQGQTASTTQRYQLTVGYDPAGNQVPTITDPSGNRMDQNGNTTNGEPGPSPQGDQYVQQIVLDAVSDRLEATAFPSTLTAGTIGPVTIEQKNPNGTRDTTATGVLNVSTSGPGTIQLFQDAAGTIPLTNPQLSAGIVTFYIRMTVAGAYPIQVTTAGAVNATGFTTTVNADVATQAFLSPSAAAVNSPGQVTYTLTFQDQFNNPTNYAGTATITYGGAAVAPGSPTAVPVNTAASQNTFVVTTQQTGTVTVTATVPRPSPGTGTIASNTATIAVNPGSATTVTITPVGSGPFTAGSPITFTVTVTDASGNLVDVDGPLSVNPGGAGTVSPATPVLVDGRATFTVVYGTPGSYAVTVTSGALNGTSGTFVVAAQPPRPSPTEGLTGVFAAATDASVRDAFGNVIQDGSPFVSVFNPDGSQLTTLLPFPPGFAGEVDAGSPGFTGGIRVSVADVTGDGIADYVIGSGPTITATVIVYNGATQKPILTLRPFADFKGGVFVSTGDLTGDGIADIVITPDQGGGPRVTIIKGGTFTQVANFFGIDDVNFRGGARAAMGDVNGDGFADLVVSAGFGGGPRISIYDGAALAQGTRLNVIGDFFLFEEALRNGAYVAVGDVNGDGFADLIGGAGPGGGPRVLILDSVTMLQRGTAAALSAPLFNGFLGDVNNRGGVRVAAKNLNNDRFTDLLIGAGEGGGSRAEAYNGDGFGLLQSIDLLPGFSGGVFVG